MTEFVFPGLGVGVQIFLGVKGNGYPILLLPYLYMEETKGLKGNCTLFWILGDTSKRTNKLNFQIRDKNQNWIKN